MYAQLGHDGPPTNFWREHLITGKDLARCPVRELLDARERIPELHDEVVRYVQLYLPAYQDGHLLVAGGIADQPARYLSMIQELLRLSARADEKYLELTPAEDGGKG